MLLCVSPQSDGSPFVFIYLNVIKRIYQDPLLAFFNNVGQAIYMFPCPDFDAFLWSNLIGAQDGLFITNLLAYIILEGR
jgi:hypothetical protein